MSAEPLSAVIVPVPELAHAVDPWLERSANVKPSHGIPPHVTLLLPSPADADGIRGALADVDAFDVELGELRRFRGGQPILYLAPESSSMFVRATEMLVARFPEWLPYGGAFDEIVPHLTVAVGEACDAAEAEMAPLLPLRGRAREAVLVTRAHPPQWVVRARFPFREA